MANQEHLLTLKKGTEAWNRWREKRHSPSWDFFEADLSRADLSGQDLSYRNFKNTDLSGARMRLADIRGADFSGARLDDVDFSLAIMGSTTFCNVDLRNTKGLDTVRHFAPSSIGVDTIYKSEGSIVTVFLRGAGVPENLIENIASLAGAGIEFYSLFISYSHHDEAFAERLHNDLQAKGVRCWYAPEDMPGGKKLHEVIDTAIRMHDKLLLILSEDSVSSEWVKTEISKARKREIKEDRQVLFPIRLCSFEELCDWECFDADTGKDSAREIREFYIPDFSNWKDHDSYKKEFDKLLRDLQGKCDTASC